MRPVNVAVLFVERRVLIVEHESRDVREYIFADLQETKVVHVKAKSRGSDLLAGRHSQEGASAVRIRVRQSQAPMLVITQTAHKARVLAIALRIAMGEAAAAGVEQYVGALRDFEGGPKETGCSAAFMDQSLASKKNDRHWKLCYIEVVKGSVFILEKPCGNMRDRARNAIRVVHMHGVRVDRVSGNAVRLQVLRRRGYHALAAGGRESYILRFDSFDLVGSW